MSDPAPEPSIAQLSAKIDDLVLGLKWLLSLFLFVASIPNFFASLAIVRFQQIFQDALPGKPLPDITVALVYCPHLYQLLALLWPIVGIIIIARGKRVRNWMIPGVLLILVVGLQLLLTQYALFIPMVGLIDGMS